MSNVALGTNLTGLTWYGTEAPFLNLMKNMAGWYTTTVTYPGAGGDGTVTTTAANNDTGEESAYYASFADANGYPTTLTGGPAHTFNAVYGKYGGYYEGGQFDVYYDGAGLLEYADQNAKDAVLVSRSAGHDVINCTTGNGGLMIYIVQTTGGNTIKNIRLIPSAQNAAYVAGKTLHPFFVNKFNNARPGGWKCMRFMDWQVTLESSAVNWADRTQAGYPFYARFAAYTIQDFGAAIEQLCYTCNELNCDMWICMPAAATQTYMSNAASLVLSLLNSNLNVYVESWNEYWNCIFGAGGASPKAYFTSQGPTFASTYSVTPYTGSNADNILTCQAVNTSFMSSAWRAVWTGADASRLKIVLGQQTGGAGSFNSCAQLQSTLWSGHFINTNIYDVVATAAYFAFGGGVPIAWTDTDTYADPPAKFFQETTGIYPNLPLPDGYLADRVTLANTCGGTASALTLSTAGDTRWGNGGIPATPANGTLIQFTVPAGLVAGTPPVTLKVDGGNAFHVNAPLTYEQGPQYAGTYSACFTTGTASYPTNTGHYAPGFWCLLASTAGWPVGLPTLSQNYMYDGTNAWGGAGPGSDVSWTASLGKPLVGYEAGQSLVDSDYNNGYYTDPSRVNYFATCNRDARMGDVYTTYFTALFNANPNKLINNFADIGFFDQHGYWAVLESRDQTTSPRYAALIALMGASAGGAVSGGGSVSMGNQHGVHKGRITKIPHP